MLKNTLFSHILNCCSTSPSSLSVTLYLVPVFMKPLLKSQCALIGQQDQCVVIGQLLQGFQKCHTPNRNSTRPLGVNYLN